MYMYLHAGATVNSQQLRGIRPLHTENLVVACTVVERVGALGEVLQDIVTTELGNPGAVKPGLGQELVLGGRLRAHF